METNRKPVKRKQPEEMTLEELENEFARIRQKRTEYMRKYRQKHSEKFRQYTKEYKAKWRAKNRDRINEYHRKWCNEHPEAVREHSRKWRSEHPDYAKRRWARYKLALEKARAEQRNRIQRDIQEMKNRKGGE